MRLGWLLSLLVLVPSAARAGGFYLPDLGVRALGRAGAFAANPDDGTAAWYNPAGFADQRGTTLMLDQIFSRQSINYQRTDERGVNIGFPIGNNGAPKWIPFLGLTSDFGLKNLTFALSVYGPVSKDTVLPAAGSQRYSTIESQSTEGFYQFSVGWRVTKWLKLGAGFRPGWFKTRQILAVAVLAGEEGTSDAKVTFETSDSFTLNGSLGMVLSPAEWFDFGVSYRFPAAIHSSGTLTADEADLAALRANNPSLRNLELRGNAIDLNLEMPKILRAGVRFKHSRFDLEADFVWEDWSGFGKLEIVPKDIRVVLTGTTETVLPTITQERNYGNAYSVRLGSDIRILPGRLTARLGFFYELPAVPDTYLNAGLVDTEKVGTTVGLTARFGWFALSVSYAHVQHFSKSITNSEARQINITYLALDQPNLAPVVGNGRYRAGWDLLSIGLSFDIDGLAGWKHRKR